MLDLGWDLCGDLKNDVHMLICCVHVCVHIFMELSYSTILVYFHLFCDTHVDMGLMQTVSQRMKFILEQMSFRS